MANTFLSKQLEINLAAATAYTVPVGTTTVVIGMRFGNKTNGDISVHADLDRAGAKSKVVGAETPIPVGSALEGVMGSKLVMQEGDILEVGGSADACADLTLSIMEMTP
jgi:hypothetical protein